jgi:hypothetical protein
VTKPGRTPREPGPRPQPDRPLIPDPRAGDKDMREMRDPYDLPFPDRWPPGRPQYVIVVDQLRDWQPGQPPSLAELLETGRTRQPEPDLEAEP